MKTEPNVNTPPAHPDSGAAVNKSRPDTDGIVSHFYFFEHLISIVFCLLMLLIALGLHRIFG